MRGLEGRARVFGLPFFISAAAYLLLALFVLRPILPSPGRLLPYPAILDRITKPQANLTRLDHRDQSMVVSVVTRNAALLTSEPWNLFDGFGQCYPMPRSYTLGEHMFGTGMLAAIPYAVTRDPIVSYNAALLLTLWIPALTMYVFSYTFTRSAPAAFVAGLLFMMIPQRAVDPSHPYVHGDLWGPLVLLFLHRLFTREGWSDALLFAAFLSLEVFESLYPLVAVSLFVIVFGIHLAMRRWRRLPRLLPKIVLAAAIVLLSTWLVLGPYLETREVWGLLGGRSSVLLKLRDYAFGGFYFPGVLAVVFTGIAIADRMRGPRPTDGEDPRLAIFLAGWLVLWTATAGIPIPFTDLVLPSPLALAKDYVPGLDAVRALSAVSTTANLAWSFLAGYGILALIERRGTVAKAVAVLGATAGTFLFMYHGSFAKPAYFAAPTYDGLSFELAAWEASPQARDVELLRRASRGAVLDLPFPMVQRTASTQLARHLLLNSYHPGPTAACYNSFVSPVQTQIGQLAEALPDRSAADALAALGFGTVVLDKERIDAANLQLFFDGLRELDNWERLRPVGRTARLVFYHLSSPLPVTGDFAVLAADAVPDGAVGVAGRKAGIDFVFLNRGEETFRQPDPIEPSDLLATWRDVAGRIVLETRLRALLPIAVAPGARFPVRIELPLPAKRGAYSVTLARAEAPEQMLAARSVQVGRRGPARER